MKSTNGPSKFKEGAYSIQASTISISMFGGKMGFLHREDDNVRGCPGKRFLSLVILSNDVDPAGAPLRRAFGEGRDCLYKLDAVCTKACKFLWHNSERQIKLFSMLACCLQILDMRKNELEYKSIRNQAPYQTKTEKAKMTEKYVLHSFEN